LATGCTIVPFGGTYARGWSVANSYAANEKLNIAGIGVSGRGGAHVDPSLKENLVAACDSWQDAVDGCLRRAEKARTAAGGTGPVPKGFADYRKMFDEMADQIDAVFVATPDHHHAPASMMAIRHRKHVYCEKPLTHDIYEARQLMLAAREYKVATQMGNQGRAEEGWRILCEVIWSGMIGHVREVHVWTDRPGISKRFW
jgi:predicted dehydrogenase